MPSESACYPRKAFHGHIMNYGQGPRLYLDALWPAGERKEDDLATNHYNCPIVIMSYLRRWASRGRASVRPSSWLRSYDKKNELKRRLYELIR